MDQGAVVPDKKGRKRKFPTGSDGYPKRNPGNGHSEAGSRLKERKESRLRVRRRRTMGGNHKKIRIQKKNRIKSVRRDARGERGKLQG